MHLSHQPKRSSNKHLFSITWIGLLLLLCSLKSVAQTTAQPSSAAFADTTGGYGFMYLTVNCFECFPRNLVYYKKFIIVSGIYKISNVYHPTSARSATHFRAQIIAQNYFVNKEFQLWKSPQVFNSLDEIIEYKDEFIKRLTIENYKVINFNDRIDTKTLSDAQ
jgi:hypothetical protein